nr:hypothetical protein [uncultured Draconibacterium sp.]
MSLRYRDLPEIPASQLRPGNTVTTGQAQVTIKSVSENYCRVVFHHKLNGDYVEVRKLSELRPVIVNETRIEKLGFKQINRHDFYHPVKNIMVRYDGEDVFRVLLCGSDKVIAEGNFVNHLQNLIEDLSIKEFKL